MVSLAHRKILKGDGIKNESIKNISLASKNTHSACYQEYTRLNPHSLTNHTSKESFLPSNVKNIDLLKRKRCPYAPCSKELKGSYTVEAALVMPLFIFAAIAIIFLMRIVMVQWGVKTALDETAKMVSVCGGSIDDKTFLEPTELSVAAIATERIAKNGTPLKFVTLGIAGFDFLESEVTDTDVNIVVKYYMKVPINSAFIKKGFQIKQRSFAKRFTGFQSESEDLEADTYVYVTKYGEAYHKSLECAYLKLSIKGVSEEDLPSLRNNGGHKYYGCEYCGKKGYGAYYITDDGECYHTRLDCKGLKRTISRVKLEEAKKDHHACSKCCGED